MGAMPAGRKAQVFLGTGSLAVRHRKALFLATSLIGLLLGAAWGDGALLPRAGAEAGHRLRADVLKNSPVLGKLLLVIFGVPAFLRLDLGPVGAAVITLSADAAAFVWVVAVSAIKPSGRDRVEAARAPGACGRAACPARAAG